VDGAPSLPPALRTLIETGRNVVGRSQVAQVGIARLDGIVVAEHLPALSRTPVAAAIKRARAETCMPLAISEVRSALKGEWGEDPDRVLDSLEEKPIAVGPHAQVHRAELDGRAVAVKVLRPGLAAAARSELSLLDLLGMPARMAFPALDTGPLIREVRERALDEFDLEHEGEGQRRAARALAGVEGVEVAKVQLEHTTPGVLVADFVEHPLLTDPGVLEHANLAAIAHTLVRVYAGALGEFGAVLANARASDVAVHPDGRSITLLHAGASRPVNRVRLEAAVGAVKALRMDEPETFALAMKALGLLRPDDALGAHELIRYVLGDLLTGPATLDDRALERVSDRAAQRGEELLRLAARTMLQPEDLWVGRALGQTVSLLARLGVQEDWVALALGDIERGWW